MESQEACGWPPAGCRLRAGGGGVLVVVLVAGLGGGEAGPPVPAHLRLDLPLRHLGATGEGEPVAGFQVGDVRVAEVDLAAVRVPGRHGPVLPADEAGVGGLRRPEGGEAVLGGPAVDHRGALDLGGAVVGADRGDVGVAAAALADAVAADQQDQQAQPDQGQGAGVQLAAASGRVARVRHDVHTPLAYL